MDYLRVGKDTYDWIGALNILENIWKRTFCWRFSTWPEKGYRRGGVLVAVVPNAISPFGNLTRHWDFTHEWAFTPNNFLATGPHCRLLSRHRVQGVRAGTPRLHQRIAGWLLWQGIRAALRFYFLVEVADSKGRVYHGYVGPNACRRLKRRKIIDSFEWRRSRRTLSNTRPRLESYRSYQGHPY